jgi:hypothetical protein
MQQYDYMIKAILVVLVPLLPAYVMFKAFPESQAAGEGPFAGMKWKLGGAFAGYILVVLILLGAMKMNYDPPPNEVWTVRGRIVAGKPISRNMLKVTTQPTDFDVSEDGFFSLKLVGQRKGQEMRFPRLVFDMTTACLAVKSVGIDKEAGTSETSGTSETFSGLVKPTAPPVKFKMNKDAQEIVFETPVTLERLSDACAG